MVYHWVKRNKMDEKLVSITEPIQSNRFRVTFPVATGIDGMFVMAIDKPTYRPDKTHLPWDDIYIRFCNPIGPSVSQQIHNYIRKVKITREDYFEDPLFKITLEGLDRVGETIEKWEIDIALILSVDFGKYDMQSTGDCTVIMKVRPSKCVLLF